MLKTFASVDISHAIFSWWVVALVRPVGELSTSAQRSRHMELCLCVCRCLTYLHASTIHTSRQHTSIAQRTNANVCRVELGMLQRCGQHSWGLHTHTNPHTHNTHTHTHTYTHITLGPRPKNASASNCHSLNGRSEYFLESSALLIKSCFKASFHRPVSSNGRLLLEGCKNRASCRARAFKCPSGLKNRKGDKKGSNCKTTRNVAERKGV